MNKKINDSYKEVIEVYKHTKQATNLAALLSNIGVLCLSVCGLLKSSNIVASWVFALVLMFFIAENNYALYSALEYNEKVVKSFQDFKKKLENDKEAQFVMPEDTWNSYIISITIEIVLCLFGYLIL